MKCNLLCYNSLVARFVFSVVPGTTVLALSTCADKGKVPNGTKLVFGLPFLLIPILLDSLTMKIMTG